MYKNEAKAYKEIYEILNLLDKQVLEKIPLQIREKIENEKDNNYNFQISSMNELESIQLLESTKVMLTILYKDYLANQEEKEKIEKKLELIQDTLEKNKREKYNPDNIFKNKETIKNTFDYEKTELIEYKESLFKKIIKFLKNLFNNK